MVIAIAIISMILSFCLIAALTLFLNACGRFFNAKTKLILKDEDLKELEEQKKLIEEQLEMVQKKKN